ncbi:hypothetical protein GBAR_LOCUS7415, partial [Geodia barretti]
DTTGCARAFVRCLKQIPTPVNSPSSTSTDTSAVTIGSSVGAVIISLLTAMIIVLIALKRRAVNSSKKERGLSSTSSYTPPKMNLLDKKLSVELKEQLHWQLRHKNMIISKAQIHLSSTIGQGEFGLVFKGYVDGGNLAAIKTSKGRRGWNALFVCV